MSASEGGYSLRGRVLRRGAGPASSANVANIITVVRILAAPVFLALLLADDGRFGIERWIAAVLFVVAIATDGLDGYLARRNDLVTDLGKLLDPIADKVLTGGALVGLSILAELPWWVTIVILVREVGITVFRFAMLRREVIAASRGGKLKTLLQAVALSLALLPLPALLGDALAHGINTVLMSAAVVATVVTGLDYLLAAWRSKRRMRE